MRKQINLIPPEMVVPSRSVTLSKTLYKIATYGAIVAGILVFALIISLVYFNLEYKKTIAKIDGLETKIVSLEKSEQKLILAKDKLSKINYVTSLDAVDNELVNFKKFEETISSPSGTKFTDISIDTKKTETSLLITDRNALSEVISNLANQKDYLKVVMTSLSYNKTAGYLVSLVFNNK